MTTDRTRQTPRIEAVHVKNYRVLRDVRLTNISPLTVLIGPNGSGKSTLFDVFAFLSECFANGLPAAWERRGRMHELRSRAQEGPVSIELKYREHHSSPVITYHLEIDEQHHSPVVTQEWLAWRRKRRYGAPFKFLSYEMGTGDAIGGDEPDESATRTFQPLTSPDLLAVNTLGQFQEHPRVAALRRFITGWYLSYLTAPELRRLRESGPERRLSASGDNLANVLQHLQRTNPDHLIGLFDRLAARVPQLEAVTARELPGGTLLLELKDEVFDEPILARYVSDGTMKLLAYLLVLRDQDPPPLVGIEEPENFVHPGLLRQLAEECMAASSYAQVIATTHAPQFLDALDAKQVRVMSRGSDGYSNVRIASDMPGVGQYLREGGLLGDAWEQGMFDWPALSTDAH